MLSLSEGSKNNDKIVLYLKQNNQHIINNDKYKDEELQ